MKKEKISDFDIEMIKEWGYKKNIEELDWLAIFNKEVSFLAKKSKSVFEQLEKFECELKDCSKHNKDDFLMSKSSVQIMWFIENLESIKNDLEMQQKIVDTTFQTLKDYKTERNGYKEKRQWLKMLDFYIERFFRNLTRKNK